MTVREKEIFAELLNKLKEEEARKEKRSADTSLPDTFRDRADSMAWGIHCAITEIEMAISKIERGEN